MAVTPSDVKKLRDKTGAGMLDCKNALVEANGDYVKAEKVLKEKGLASADKRSGRATNQGAIFTKIGNNKAALIELTSETDFVAKNDVFRKSGQAIADKVHQEGFKEINDELTLMVKEAIAVLKENMTLKRIYLEDYSDNDLVVDYLHNGGQIGVLIKLKCDSPKTASNEEVKALAFDLALHAAAFNPTYLNRDAVDPVYLKEQEEIFQKQVESMDKPANVIQGIIKGKLNKHLSQICFVDQSFVKNDKISVKKAIEEVAKSVGGSVELGKYVYFMIGE
jgi:elongation factor Ts